MQWGYPPILRSSPPELVNPLLDESYGPADYSLFKRECRCLNLRAKAAVSERQFVEMRPSEFFFTDKPTGQ